MCGFCMLCRVCDEFVQLATKFNQQFNTSKLGRHTSSSESRQGTCITTQIRALWSGASVDDITKYKQYVDLYLDYIYVPVV